MPDLDWTLLTRYVAGECSADERARVERWMGEGNEYLRGLAAIDWVAAQGKVQVSEIRRAELQAELQAAIQADRVPTPIHHRPTIGLALKIAAAVLLVVGLSVGGVVASRHTRDMASSPTSTARAITTARGQRLSLRLPDGTFAVLAPASTLRFDGTYGARDRVVTLVGQASFTVVHDARHPFVVLAGNLVAKDLGTRFAVRSYPRDSVAEVAVAEGTVAVSGRSVADSIILKRADRGRLSSNGRLSVTHDVPLEGYFAWTEGRLVFRGTPLPDAVAELERWYDVDIRLDSPAMARRAVSGAVIEGRPASDALQVIATVLGLELVQTAPRTFVLRAGH